MTHAVLKKGWNESGLKLAGRPQYLGTAAGGRLVRSALARYDNRFRRGDAWAGGSRCESAG